MQQRTGPWTANIGSTRVLITSCRPVGAHVGPMAAARTLSSFGCAACLNQHREAPSCHHNSARRRTVRALAAANSGGGGGGSSGGGSTCRSASPSLLGAASVALSLPAAAAAASAADLATVAPAAASSSGSSAAVEGAAAAVSAAAASAAVGTYVPGPVEVGWEIWVGFIAGVIPFAIATYEFRCGVHWRGGRSVGSSMSLAMLCRACWAAGEFS